MKANDAKTDDLESI